MSADIRTGDCLSVMPTLAADSIDAIVTDPPYGLGFMGKAWDHGVPGVEFWTAAKRVAKPGAHLVAFGGTRTYHRLACAIEDAGWEIRDCLSWLYGSGFPKSHNGPWGGTALKPAWEPVILARKPLRGTVAAIHAEHGTGALNIDGCRVATVDVLAIGAGNLGYRGADASNPGTQHDGGRWPANVALDEEAAAVLDGQAPDAGAAGRASGPTHEGFNKSGSMVGHRLGMGERATAFHADAGGASRFFYTSKAGRAERNAGVEKNHHPTVKPLDLMQWLCRLVTPKGGLILDPFTGSGSTGRAAVAEGFRFLGIELNEEYAAIARARVAEYAPLFTEIA